MEQVKFKDFINFDKRIGKIIVSGIEGSGKTLLLTAIAVGKMLHGLQDCWKSYDAVDEYNALGFNFSKNYEHLLFSNFDINCAGTNIPDRKAYRCNPFRLGLFDEDFDTDFFPPYALFCITEAYNVLNSYLYDKFRDSFKAFFKTSRQAKYDWVIDTQYFGDICTLFRRITNRFIWLEKECEEIKDKEGIVIGHKLFVLEFLNNRDAEHFEATSDPKNAKQYELILPRCYYKNYDTEYCRFLHLQGREMQDFFVEHFDKIESKEQIVDLLEQFGAVAPEGFFKTSKVEKKQTFFTPQQDMPPVEDYGF